MLVPTIFLAIAILSSTYVAYEILRWIADMLGYLETVRRFGADLHWWMDARFSVIPAEQHLAVEILADHYELVGAR